MAPEPNRTRLSVDEILRDSPPANALAPLGSILLGRHRPSNAVRQQPRAELQHHTPSAAQPAPPWVALSPAGVPARMAFYPTLRRPITGRRAGSHGSVLLERHRRLARTTSSVECRSTAASSRAAPRPLRGSTSPTLGRVLTGMCRLARHSPTLGRALAGVRARRAAPSMRGRSDHVGLRSQRRTRTARGAEHAWAFNHVGSRSQRRTRRCAWRSILRCPRSQRRTRTARGADHSWGVQSRGPRSHRHMHRLAWHSPTLGRALSGICPRRATPSVRGAFKSRWVALAPAYPARMAFNPPLAALSPAYASARMAFYPALGSRFHAHALSRAALSTRAAFHFSPVASRVAGVRARRAAPSISLAARCADFRQLVQRPCGNGPG
jgi:hypothetical protein